MVTPNQAYERNGFRPEIIVIHRTEGSFESSIAYCSQPKSHVSYHFIISETGEVTCLVMPENVAWHAGLIRNATAELIKKNINPNLYTIGIALSGFASFPPSLAQISACASLIKTMSNYYDIPLDKKHIITHNSIRADKICPGPYIDLSSVIYLAGLPQA
jgi:N-acetyl-anhydromuramyl-L-alanine amidase AmpD